MAKELSKIYEPQSVEKRIYQKWLDGNYFHAERDPEKKSFTIVIPPPNVTGQLHMGHALDETIQDILIRYKRMAGFSALWLPGYDHAGIATQIKVEEKLRNEGLTRFDLGRKKFLDEVWAWKERYGGRIVEQLRTLGSSCDWKRQHFTMDDTCARAVRTTFVDLYKKGLIYKGKRIINWCPKCTTALSDAEVEYQDKPGHLWHIKYPIAGSEDEYIIVATTRPETMLGDTGVAVNPNDERYAHLVGKTCILPLVGRELPIVADDYVEMDFGTGCVKMTPCHDPNDFEVGQRHNLEQILILDENAKIINGVKYNGMDRYEARRAIVDDLNAQGYLVRVEDYSHNVGTCYRCGTDVEPMASDQWFVRMEPLSKEAIRVVEQGEVRFVPDRFAKTYLNWMYNVKDWCISRQLWWGHQIPAWYCADCGHITVAMEDPSCCEHCGSPNIKRDEDVLDTWFSSALWPFSTLGWPQETEDLKYFFPTDVLVTGYDIIFFWVARMIFSSCEQMKKPPFHTVFMHGLVRDAQGRKMSKSLGNGIDPVEMIEKYGADALRMNLVAGNSPGNDMRFYIERCESMRNFANKIWNASRFVLMNLTTEDSSLPDPSELEIEDKWILSELNDLIPQITDALDRYELGIAEQKIYDFIWDTFCDWYIELTKPRLYADDSNKSQIAQRILVYTLDKLLKLLHPFMPFITEEIWQAIPHEGESIMIQPWPKADERLSFPLEKARMEAVMEAIRSVRNRRSEMNVPPSRRSTMYIITAQPEAYQAGEAFIKKLAFAEKLVLTNSLPQGHESMVEVVTSEARILMPMNELVDTEKEIQRINKEITNATRELARSEGMLKNQGFVSKAPAEKIEAEKEKVEKYKAMLEQLNQSLSRLKG